MNSTKSRIFACLETFVYGKIEKANHGMIIHITYCICQYNFKFCFKFINHKKKESIMFPSGQKSQTEFYKRRHTNDQKGKWLKPLLIKRRKNRTTMKDDCTFK